MSTVSNTQENTIGTSQDQSTIQKLANSLGYQMATSMIGGFANGFASQNDAINAQTEAAQSNRANQRQAAMNSGNPIAMGAALADGVVESTGGYSDVSNTGTNVDVANNLAAHMPGMGYLAKSVDTITVSDEMKLMANSYADTAFSVNQATSNSGGNFLFGRSKINALIRKAKEMLNKVNKIKQNADEDFAMQSNTVGTLTNQVSFNYNGGMDANVHAAKSGGTLELNSDDKFFDQMFASFMGDTQSFKQGGAMNVIPTGALHARLHHMENSEDLTQKGIPVVDNDGNQQAEIERNEIIFHYDLTQRLEQLCKKFNECEDQSESLQIAIEAGKILTCEILENTQDNTKLIKQTKL